MNQEIKLADMDVMPGGWFYGPDWWLTKARVKEVEKRWFQRSDAAGKQEPGYDGWIEHQCGGCRYIAAAGLDWGICWNEKSSMDGRVVFEHGGCVCHSDYEEAK